MSTERQKPPRARRVWLRRGYANERDGCMLETKITGGLVVSTTSFGGAGHPIRDFDGSTRPPEAFTAVARPFLCRGRGRGGYHWGSVQSVKITWPFSMAGLAELHEATVARVLRGEVAIPPFCAQCHERELRTGPWLRL